jgi:hypothetical protein
VIEQRIIRAIIKDPQKLERALTRNPTDPHDIHKDDTENNTHVSIKCTCNNTIGLGDARRILQGMNEPDKEELIVVQYRQKSEYKYPFRIVSIEWTAMKQILLGNMEWNHFAEDINRLDTLLKRSEEYKPFFLQLKNRMKIANCLLKLAPKIGNKTKKRMPRLQMTVNLRDIEKHTQFIAVDKECYKECMQPLLSCCRKFCSKNNT